MAYPDRRQFPHHKTRSGDTSVAVWIGRDSIYFVVLVEFYDDDEPFVKMLRRFEFLHRQLEITPRNGNE
jgi:hypothetical protein